MTRIPYVSYLVLGDEPHLTGQRCTSCQAIFLDRRNACGRCGQRTFETVALARNGAIRAFTIVHRATPDVRVPYISVVIDLEDGGTVKANLVDCEPDPNQIPLGGRVCLTTQLVAEDPEGSEAVAFAFCLAGNAKTAARAGAGE
jgi:uncharacterized protein